MNYICEDSCLPSHSVSDGWCFVGESRGLALLRAAELSFLLRAERYEGQDNGRVRWCGHRRGVSCVDLGFRVFGVFRGDKSGIGRIGGGPRITRMGTNQDRRS